MDRILVWDIPTRAFHWLLTGVFGAALGIALVVDDDSSAFQIHMLLGLVAGFMVVLRLVWGLVGSRYARFGSFLFGPKALLDYLRGVFRRSGERHLGHNPGSAYVIYGILLLTLGLALTGVLMPSWREAEELHEIMAHLTTLLVGAHVAGIVWHTIRHRENVALSMIDGHKRGRPTEAAHHSHGLAGVVFIALCAGCTLILFSGHDPRSGQLTLLGQTIHLGESERNESDKDSHDDKHCKSRRDNRHHRDHDDHHEDDD